MTETFASGPSPAAPAQPVATAGSTRVDRSCPEGGSRFDAVLTHWAVRLVVVISMLAALVVGIVGGALPAGASLGALWTQLSPTTSPGPLSGASIAYDSATGQTILFGGNANGTALNATWAWTGSNWSQLDDANDAGCTSVCSASPSARHDASFAYDAATSQLLLFGGTNGGGYLNDTWSWTGTTWSALVPTNSPTIRDGASLAYDGASGQANLVLFGGYNGTYLQDTWTWSGTNWIALSPLLKPPSRDEAAFGYDTATSQMLLFGGYNGSDLADTYSWTGTNWSALSPTTSPPARFGAGTGYSPALGELALFGGQGASATYYGDTWVWTQSGNWAQLSSSTSPSARVLPAMTFDPATGQMVLFGGNGASYDSDTWQWSAVAVTAVTTTAGPLAGGTSVTITGIGFNGVTAVKFGSVAVPAGSYNVVSPAEITASSPAESAGTVDITVTNLANTSAVNEPGR